METHIQHQKNKENDVEKQNIIHEGGKHSATASPSSSPSHEFSFTISLHSSSTTTTTTKPPPPSLALDLSPADDIFFHGHLLPLQLLSHFPSSPRFSTNSSIDSCSLPIRDLLLQDENNTSNREHNINNIRPTVTTTTTTKEDKEEIKSISKPASFSLFGSTKGGKDKEEKNNKRKMGYDHVINAMKKYLRMMLFRGRREKVGLFQGQAYSRSGNIMRKSKLEVRGRNSAPASMRTSPTNSGLLFAAAPAASNDSTMEELQAAIQAAIAHCKNSIAKEDKLISS